MRETESHREKESSPEVHKEPQDELGEFRVEAELNSAEQEFQGLVAAQQEGLKRIEKAVDELGLDKKAADKILGEMGLNEKLRNIRKSAEGLFSKFKRLAVPVLIALTLAQAMEVRAQSIVQGRDLHELPTFTQSEMQAQALTLPVERAYVSLDQGQTMIQIAEGNTFSVKPNLEDLREIVSDDTKELHFVHTHPLESATSIGFDPAEARDDPHPPSANDIFFHLSLQRDYEDQEIKSRVYDPTGVWVFGADKEHPRVKKFYHLVEQIEEIENEYKQKKDEIYDEYAQRFDEILQDGEILTSERLVQERQAKENLNVWKDGELNALGEGRDRAMAELTDSPQYKEVFENLVNQNTTKGFAVFLSDRFSGNREKLIEQHIEFWRENGIEMSYAPYSQEK